MARESEQFPGFPPEIRGNFWMYPRAMDGWWPELSGSEQKTLDFVLRKLTGWEKQTDQISLSQFEKGTGLSQRQIVTAVQELERKRFIQVSRSIGRTNGYSLVVQEVHPSSEKTSTGAGAQNAHAGSEKTAYTIDNIPIDRAIEKMYRFYSQIIRPGQRLTREARKNLTDRFAEYHPQKLVCAMKNARDDDYWNGIVRTNTIAWFFSSEEQIARFLALGPHDWQEDSGGQAKP